jgi:hypothetical protein
MKSFHLITFLIVLQLPSTFSNSSQKEIDNVSTACSNPSDCKIYLAQNNSTESSVDMPETKPIEEVSEKLESVSNPLGKASESIESISKPIESLSKPLESVSEPLSSVSKPLGSVSKPVDSYLQPVDSLNNSQESESEIEEGKEESGGLGVKSVPGEKGEMVKEPSAVEEKYNSSDSEESLEELFKGSENVDVIEQHYDRIKGTGGTYCKWTDENGMIHIESGEKCTRE